MAQGDGIIFNQAKMDLMKGLLDFDGHVLKAALVHGYTPDIDTDDGWADISANECAGTNYTAGGATLGSAAVTEDTTSNLGKFDAADVTWSSILLTTPANGTPSHLVLYDDDHASKCLIAAWEITTATNGGNYTIQWNASGIITLT